MTLYYLTDSTDLHLFVPVHRTHSLAFQLLALSGLAFKSSPATLLVSVRDLLGQKILGRSRFTSYSALQHLQNLGLEVV